MRKKKVRPLCYEKPSEKSLKLKPLCAFDMETEGLGGKFIVCAIWTSDDVRMLFHSLDHFFQWMLDHPEYLYLAHNAVGYEFAYLAPLLHDWFNSTPGAELRPTIQGESRIVQFTLTIPNQQAERKSGRRGKPAKTVIDIRDTLCLFSMSLAKVAKAFCPELPKLKGNIDFEKETFDPTNQDHIDYVYRDCEIVLRAYERHAKNIANVFGTALGVTAGSTALRAFRSTIPKTHVYYRVNKDAESFIRRAYYGGLVVPGHSVGNWGAIGSVDANGAYGFQMAKHLYPVGSPYIAHCYVPGRIGFYQCIATVPPTVFDTLGFNPVPCKDREGLSWPTGTFETFLSSPEIEYAREKGCTIEVLCGYVFTRQEPIFKSFIEKCQEMELFEEGRFKPSIKQIRNSGYGKFGSKEIHPTLKFSRKVIISPDWQPVLREDNRQIIPGIYVGTEVNDAEYIMPHWAALITAYERLYIMKYMEMAYALGAQNVYVDTDSIKCDLPVIERMVADALLPVGNLYGQFKLEEVCRSFILLGPKCFYGETDGMALVKAKGIPNGVLTKKGKVVYTDAIEALNRPLPKGKKGQRQEQAREIEFVSVKSVMSIIKEKSHVKPINRKRKITDLRNSYAWQITEDGKIYPRGYPIKEENNAVQAEGNGGYCTVDKGSGKSHHRKQKGHHEDVNSAVAGVA